MQAPTDLVNGQPSDLIAVTNRGLAYGDGIFETIRFQRSEPVLWELHWQRLLRGCEILGLNLPDDCEVNLLQQCSWLLDKNSLTQAVLKVVLIRDGIGRGYRSDRSSSLHTIVSISILPDYPRQNYLTGVRVWLCKTRLAVNPQFEAVKHLNRLEQVLASREWPDSGYQEGIMMDTSSHIIEGTKSNVFFVEEGALVTPSLEGSGVAGVMREYLFLCARELGLRINECAVALPDLTSFQEAFICNSVFGIWPIISLDVDNDKTLKWGPGEITRCLQQTVADRLLS